MLKTQTPTRLCRSFRLHQFRAAASPRFLPYRGPYRIPTVRCAALPALEREELARPATMAPTKPSPGLKVLSTGSALVTSTGATLLGSLAPEASVRAEGAGVVVGLATRNGGATARFDVALGKLVEGRRFLALGRTSLWWMTPAFGSSAAELPVETQLLLVEVRPGEEYALLLPLIDAGAFRATLRPAARGALGLRIESGSEKVVAAEWRGALYVGAGGCPFELLQRGVAAAAAASGGAKPRSAKAVPPSVDVFGWCTWDAFYSRVCASGVLEGVESLAKGGAPPGLVILDDGWQQTDVDSEYRPAKAKAKPAVAGDLGNGAAAAQNGAAAAQNGAAARNGTAVQNGAAASNNGAAGSAPDCADLTAAALGPSSQRELEVVEARHEVAEAALGLLASHGDPTPDQVQGEHLLEEAEAAAALAAAEAAAAKAAPAAAAAMSPASRLGAAVAAWEAALRSAAALAVARAEAALFRVGAAALESATSGSLLVRVFSYLAAGPLRATLLRFYANSSDHFRRLTSVRANAKFSGPGAGAEAALSSEGGELGAVVSAIKRRHGVRYVYAWHAMGAFWAGVNASDPGVAHYNPVMLRPIPTPGMLEADPAVAWVQATLGGVCLPLDPSTLHGDMHAYLAGCGVDGVKVDVQGTIGLAGSAAGGGAALTATYHASLESSARRHFPGNHLINCMCHSTEDLYRMEDTNLARVSDDFYPTRVASHTAHIGNCAYNSLLIGEIATPDWDMFHSKHPSAVLHATARAISGGPVYVSDRPGHHDFALLRRLVLPDGGVLRCRLPARPTADCLFADVLRDGATPLKVWSVNAVTGVVGVFNVQGSAFSRPHRAFKTHDATPRALTARVKPSDVAELAGAADRFVLYSDERKEFSVLEGAEGGVDVTVAGGGGCDVITVSPVALAGGVMFAPVGLIGMLNCGGAVLASALEAAPGRAGGGAAIAALRVKGGGEFLAYASRRPGSVEVGGATVSFAYDDGAGAMRFAVAADGSECSDCVIRF